MSVTNKIRAMLNIAEKKPADLAEVLSELWVLCLKAGIANTCFFYGFIFLIFGYFWYNRTDYEKQEV